MTETRAHFTSLGGARPCELFSELKTPCYIIDEAAIRRNCEILAGVAQRTGCKILLAQKAFSNWTLYPLIAEYAAGTEASGLYEARLGSEEMPNREVHVFCAAYREDEMPKLLNYVDHIVFNSPTQLQKYGKAAKAAGKSIGLRINPECSTQDGHEIYDPCAAGSRLGTTRRQWDRLMTNELISMLDGLHFHTLCEQDSDALKVTLTAVEEHFGDILPRMKWLNMGGGHHITRVGYNIPRLEETIRYAHQKWNLQVYLEPGEAWALNAGYLASRVLDIVENGGYKAAILDASAACHMPDVIEMPYTPPLYGAAAEKDAENSDNAKFIFRLGGPTCLSGDIIGDYAFDAPLNEGDIVLFGDLAIYSMCKNNTFNGMALPDIIARRADGSLHKVRSFGYKDFKFRLGE